MGKKKATKSKLLRPALEKCINDNDIYVREKPKEFYSGVDFVHTPFSKYISAVYEIIFGIDCRFVDGYYNKECIFVVVYVSDDKIHNWNFLKTQLHVLDSNNSQWFEQQLLEIVTMSLLGAYQSQTAPTIFSENTVRLLAGVHKKNI
jgi:hypothetical protein